MKIWAHTLVKNEERYVWFAVMSVIKYVDKVLLWDTGSTDNTYAILQEIKKQYPTKVDLRQVGEVSAQTYTDVRQEMLEQTEADWFIVVDGDEVWWDKSMETLLNTVNANPKKDSIVTRFTNLVGDIYHYQEEAAGMYNIDGVKGHLTPRAMNRHIPGLHQKNPHGTHGFFDINGVLIQDRAQKDRVHIKDVGYLHFTNLVRSSSLASDLKVVKRAMKLKHEIGYSFPLDYYYPEVFFRSRPKIVPSPWITMDNAFKQKAMWQTPLRKIKRRLLPGKVGY